MAIYQTEKIINNLRFVMTREEDFKNYTHIMVESIDINDDFKVVGVLLENKYVKNWIKNFQKGMVLK